MCTLLGSASILTHAQQNNNKMNERASTAGCVGIQVQCVIMEKSAPTPIGQLSIICFSCFQHACSHIHSHTHTHTHTHTDLIQEDFLIILKANIVLLQNVSPYFNSPLWAKCNYLAYVWSCMCFFWLICLNMRHQHLTCEKTEGGASVVLPL